jgi:putative ABC transport system substrate-binding protein
MSPRDNAVFPGSRRDNPCISVGTANGFDMDRRKFIVGALGTACVPFAVEAQQTGKLRRVGWLDYSSSAENLGVFAQAMGGRGWLDGKTLRIDYRGGEGKIERLASVAAELVRLPADVIVSPGTSETLAARKATASIPIVMVGVDDPVELGLVASLARPGGNVTGLTSARRELSGKLLSLLRELAPKSSGVAVLLDSTDPDYRVILGHLRVAAQTLKMPLNAVEVQRHTEVEPAFATISKQGNPMLIVPASSMLVPAWIADLALKYRLPLASTSAGYAYEGGLMAYTDDWNATFDRVGALVDRILRGAKPADLPVELPTQFRLIVNAKTAQALGIAVPPSIKLRADHLIE